MSNQKFRNPVPTVDVIIEIDSEDEKKKRGIVLIKRKNPPYGWAIPGGFVDYGESLEDAAVREAFEETSLDVELLRQFHSYSDPERDLRHHTISTVFVAESKGVPVAGDDAVEAEIFYIDDLPEDMAFDHYDIIQDYINNIY